MDPDEYVSMVCSSLIEVASALTSLSHNQESKVAMVSPEFLLAVAENLRVVKAVVESDGQEMQTENENGGEGRTLVHGDGGPESEIAGVTVSVESFREKISGITSRMKEKIKGAREAQEADERAKAEKKAERKAQKEKKLHLEMEQSTLPESAQDAPTSWDCPTCTFQNGLSVRKCGVCGTYRPAEAVPKVKETPKSVTNSTGGATPPRKGISTTKKKSDKRKAEDIDEVEAEEDEDEDDEDGLGDEDGEPSKKSKRGADGRKRRIFPNDRRLKVNREGKTEVEKQPSSVPSFKRAPKREAGGSSGAVAAVKNGGGRQGKKRGYASTVSNGASTPQSAFGANTPRERADSLGSEASSASGFDIGGGAGGMGGGRGSLWSKGRTDSGPEEEEEADEDQGVLMWVCAVCTLENEMRARTCAACGESRAHTTRGVPSIFLTADSPRIKRVKVSDNPRKDPLLGPEHQIDPEALPGADATPDAYAKQMGIRGNEDSVYWETVWVAIADNDPRAVQGAQGGLFTTYPHVEQAEAEATERGDEVRSASPTGTGTSTGAGAVMQTPGGASRAGEGTGLTPRTGFKIVNGQRFPDIPIPPRPQPRNVFESYVAEQPANIALSLGQLYKAKYCVDGARRCREEQQQLVARGQDPVLETTAYQNGRERAEGLPREIRSSWREEPYQARSLQYKYPLLAQVAYDCSPTIESFSGTLLDEFEAAVSEHGEQWSAVRKALKDRFTVRELQDFYYSVWCTAGYKEPRRRAERAYNSNCRAKEAAEAKEKAREAAEKKRLDKEKRRQEKEREAGQTEHEEMSSNREANGTVNGNGHSHGVHNGANGVATSGAPDGEEVEKPSVKQEPGERAPVPLVRPDPAPTAEAEAAAGAPAPVGPVLAPAPAFTSRFAPKSGGLGFFR